MWCDVTPDETGVCQVMKSARDSWRVSVTPARGLQTDEGGLTPDRERNWQTERIVDIPYLSGLICMLFYDGFPTADMLSLMDRKTIVIGFVV
jgi:hypothetical protein